MLAKGVKPAGRSVRLCTSPIRGGTVDDDLAAFCRREHGRLVGSLTLLTGDRAVAEDLAQETLARCCRDWDRLRTMDAPGAYAHRTAMNLGTSLLRRLAAERRARARVASALGAGDGAPDQADRVAVRDALTCLSTAQRRVLVARYYLGYDVAATARLLDLPVGTVKTHTARGLTALRAALGVGARPLELTADA
jgi:RNA polymerase sigma-70 factor (sigma-E family)